MSEKYYWLKIHEHFFNDEKILYLESMDNGEKYILFWQKMLLRCLKNRHDENMEYGFLRFSKKLPYNEELLSKLTRTDIDTVRVAIKYFQDLDMLEILDDGTYYIEEVNKLIGKQSSSTERVRLHREKKKLLQCNNSNVTSNTNKEETKEKKEEYKEQIKEVIDYLNKKCNKEFTYKNSKNNSYIIARLKEGHSIKDFFTVIDNKLKDDYFNKNPKYYRPETLFSISKFEGYLNETSKPIISTGVKNNSIPPDVKIDTTNGFLGDVG